ncbi:MAG: MFS transporter [Gammaproteobacteria bacterium]|nr:MFS transporter [Gammaproteobacteria bacterium]
MSNLLNSKERHASMSLAGIFSLRMLGLFMILPIFALYAHNLTGATPILIGVAIGAYGLTSGLLQAPLGWLSDRFGRKPIIVSGLIVFAIGSLIAAISHSIEGVIIGRMIQGAGAIGSTVLALTADLTREEVRTQAMSIIGMTIGLSFMSAMILGPLLSSYVGLSGIFYLTAFLAALGVLVVIFIVPSPGKVRFHRDQELIFGDIRSVIKMKNLRSLNLGVFILNATLTGLFVVLPVNLLNNAGLSLEHQWYVYLPVLLLSFVFMVPLVLIAEKYRQLKRVFTACIFMMAVSQLGLYLYHDNLPIVVFCLLVFFTGFTTLEAILPSWVSKAAPLTARGTAMGLYSSSQFMGAFVGGVAAGWLVNDQLTDGVYLAGLAAAIIWFLVAMNMNAPRHTVTRVVRLGIVGPEQIAQIRDGLLSLPGVVDVAVIPEEETAYLKVDSKLFSNQSLLDSDIAGLCHEPV